MMSTRREDLALRGKKKIPIISLCFIASMSSVIDDHKGVRFVMIFFESSQIELHLVSGFFFVI